MRKTGWCLVSVFVFWLSSFTALYSAHVATAELSGVARDKSGAPIDGVAIELASGALRWTQTTDISGNFHFANLPLGVYEISFSSAGASHSGSGEFACAAPGQYRMVADLGNDGEWKIRQDRESPAEPGARNYTRDDLQFTPNALNLWRILENTEITGTVEHRDQFGLRSDSDMLLGVSGGSWSESRVAWNGFSVTSGDGSRTLFLPDLPAVDGIAFSAMSPLTSLSGPELALQPRYGEKDFHGQAHLFFQSGALQNSNATERMRFFRITDSDERYHYSAQGNIQLGGSLSTDWRYFASVSRLQSEKWIRNHPETVDDFLTSETANVTGDLSGRDRLGFLWMGQQERQPNEGATPQVTTEATRNSTRRFQSAQAWWTHTLSPASLLDLRASFSSGSLENAMQSGALRSSRVERFPGYIDPSWRPLVDYGAELVAMLSNVRTGAAPLFDKNVDRRVQTSIQYRDLRKAPLASTHHVSAGLDIDWLRIQEQAFAYQNIDQRFFTGAPDSVQLIAPADMHPRSSQLRLHAADTISMGSLAISVALHANRTSGSIRRVSGHLRWRSLGGQLGIGYTIGHKYPTVLRAGLAQRQPEPIIRVLNAVDPNGLGRSTYSWNDLNRDGGFQQSELGSLLKLEGPRFSRLDPDTKTPYTREINLQVMQTLPWSLVFGIRGFRRVDHQLLGLVNTGVPSTAFSPLQFPDPGNDGVSPSWDDTYVTVYNQDPATLGKDSYLLTNPAGLGAFSEGFETRISQQRNRFQWEVAVTQYRAVARTGPGNGPMENDPGVFAVINDPNQSINAYGSTFFDRGLGARFLGTWTPRRFPTVSWIVSYLDGLPYGRILPVTGLNQGLIGVLATRRGPGDGSKNNGKRTAYSLETAVRLSREFRLKHGRLTGTVDGFNLLNQSHTTREAEVTSPTHLWRIPLRFEPPRNVQLGLRYSW
jgi:hypothetical protein